MTDVAVKTTDAMTVAFASMRGPYDQIPQVMGRLYGWAASQGLVPAGMPHGVYFTDPAALPVEQAEWEVWAPVAGEPAEQPANEQGLGVKRVPATTVASAMHKGPYDTISDTYDEVMRWIAENDYQVAGPPREAYLSDPATAPPEEYLTDVMVPVAT